MTSFAAFSTPSLFLSLVCTIPKFEKILSMEAELDGIFNKVTANWQKSELMPHFECCRDFHQATGCIWSIHTGEFKEFGTWLSPVWNWHNAEAQVVNLVGVPLPSLQYLQKVSLHDTLDVEYWPDNDKVSKLGYNVAQSILYACSNLHLIINLAILHKH